MKPDKQSLVKNHCGIYPNQRRLEYISDKRLPRISTRRHRWRWSLLMLLLAASECSAQVQYTPEELKVHFQNSAEDFEMTREGESLLMRNAPIFFWTNNERELLNGSTYVWEHKGRPSVLGSIFTYVWAGQTHCRYELLSLTDQPVTARVGSDIVWTPRSSRLQWKTAPGAPTPSNSATRRLSQMRALARRFSGTLQITGQQPADLRLLTQPLIRYQPTDGKVIDGAIFAFAVSTDAEILVLIETKRDSQGKPEFVYAAAPGHYHALELRLDDTPVWTAPTRMHLERGATRSDEAYTILTPVQPLPPPEQQGP